jgi:hypothetical protein
LRICSSKSSNDWLLVKRNQRSQSFLCLRQWSRRNHLLLRHQQCLRFRPKLTI